MCPTEIQRRRTRAGSNDGGIGELTPFPMSSEAKSAPASPKSDSKRFLLYPPKLHQDTGFPFPSLSERSWVSLSREQLSHAHDDGECEAALTDNRSADKQSLFRDLCQTQLSLWTFTVSTLLTYFWQKRVHLRSVVFALFALNLTFFVSCVLASVVIAAHLFNSDFAGSFGGFGDWLNDDESKHPHLIRRQNSSFNKKCRRNGGSGSTTPRSGGDKVHQQARFWQKNVATLERTYIGSSRS